MPETSSHRFHSSGVFARQSMVFAVGVHNQMSQFTQRTLLDRTSGHQIANLLTEVLLAGRRKAEQVSNSMLYNAKYLYPQSRSLIKRKLNASGLTRTPANRRFANLCAEAAKREDLLKLTDIGTYPGSFKCSWSRPGKGHSPAQCQWVPVVYHLALTGRCLHRPIRGDRAYASIIPRIRAQRHIRASERSLSRFWGRFWSRG